MGESFYLVPKQLESLEALFIKQCLHRCYNFVPENSSLLRNPCKSTAIRSQPRRRLHSLEKQDLLRFSRTDYWYQWLIVLWNPFDFVLDCMFLQCLRACREISPGTLVSSTNKTDRHDITKILLKVTLNTITLHSRSISCIEETGIPGENSRHAGSYWQTVSHNVVSSTTRHERGSNSHIHGWYILIA
jgi:hypothetical protein